MKNKNKSKKIQKFIQQQTGANGMNRNQEQEKMYREKKEKLNAARANKKREKDGTHKKWHSQKSERKAQSR